MKLTEAEIFYFKDIQNFFDCVTDKTVLDIGAKHGHHAEIILKNNPKIKLEIKSYTDSQGDDQVNLELSKKRALYVADYLVKNGIEQNKITAIGKGESDIRNRCLNGVSCSDKEHKYNRRTEFNFIK